MKLEFDSLAASAVAALSMAITSGRELANGDADLSAFVTALESLPKWKDEPSVWLSRLRLIRQAASTHKAGESDAVAILRRACTHAEVASDARWSSTARHRELVMAGMMSGALFRMRLDGPGFAAAMASELSKQATRAAKSRGKVKAMERAHTLFLEWKAGKRTFQTNTAFATAACDECGLESVQHLARLAGKWERERLADSKR